MASEIILFKDMNGNLIPSTPYDREKLQTWKVGEQVKVKITKPSARSYAHHCLYFGGLIPMAMNYWEPSGGMLTASERRIAKHIAGMLGKMSGNPEAIKLAVDECLVSIESKRKATIEAPERSLNSLRKWVAEEAGWFDVIDTPAGIKKEAKSVSFARMDQDQFNQFYTDSFSVIWSFILSRNFNTEEEAQQAIDRLMDIGE